MNHAVIWGQWFSWLMAWLCGSASVVRADRTGGPLCQVAGGRPRAFTSKGHDRPVIQGPVIQGPSGLTRPPEGTH